MSEPPAPRVTAVVLAWQAEPWLPRCVDSLLAAKGVDVDVVLVDNGCTTDDVERIADRPGVTVVRPGRNLGFAGGCNAGAAVATGDYLVLANSDLVVEPTTVARLIEVLDQPGIGITVASVRLSEDPRLINAGANPVHVLGLSWSGRMGEREDRTEPCDTAGASGACVALTRAYWQELGGFDPEYFAYHEDAELSIRTWQRGRRVVYVPDAVAVHRYEFSRNTTKLYLIERNRLLFLSTLWSARALVLLAPPLLALELAMLALGLKQGWGGAKVRGWGWMWRNLGHVRARRRQLRGERTVPDREWMRVLTDTLDAAAFALPVGTGALNALMRAYWRVVARLV